MSDTVTLSGLRFKDAKVRKSPESSEALLQTLLESEGLRDVLKKREKASYERGFGDGQNQGRKSSMEELSSLFSTLEMLLEKWKGVKEQWVTQLEPQVLRFCFRVAEKILERELLSGSANFEALIKPLLEAIPSAAQIKISVHPDDFKQAKQIRPEGLLRRPVDTFEVVENPTIKKGGCLIETNVGMIDALLETRLQEIQKSLWQEVSEKEGRGPDVPSPA